MPNTVTDMCMCSSVHRYIVAWCQFVNCCLYGLLVCIVLVKSCNFFGHLARTWTEDYVMYEVLGSVSCGWCKIVDYCSTCNIL